MSELTSLAIQPRRQAGTAPRRVLIVSDAAPHRNGVGAYYQDLMHHLGPWVDRIDIISPAIVDGQWQGGWMLPLPGDATQKFCIPNLMRLRQQMEAFDPDVVVIPTPGPVWHVWRALCPPARRACPGRVSHLVRKTDRAVLEPGCRGR